MIELRTSGVLVSVVIPCYNTKSYLDNCLESVCRQTYENLDIVLIDDGSTDGTGGKCDDWARADPRIRVLHREHEGPSSRNAGIESFRGQYCVFVDSDDMVAPGYIDEMLQKALESNADVVVCGYDRISDTGSYLSTRSLGVEGGVDLKRLSELILLDILYPSVWGKLYARDVLKTVRLGSEPVGEDVSFWTSIVNLGVVGKCEVVDSPLYLYRQREGSLMRSFDIEREHCGVAAWDKFCVAVSNRFEACRKPMAFRMVKSRIEAIDRAIEADADLAMFSEFFDFVRAGAKDYLQFDSVSFKRKIMLAVLAVSPAVYCWVLGRLRR